MAFDRDLIAGLSAVASAQRFRIIAALAGGEIHVSELARRLEMSRPLLYMHLLKLEEAGFVAGHLELSPNGKALKVYEVVPFRLEITPESISGYVNELKE